MVLKAKSALKSATGFTIHDTLKDAQRAIEGRRAIEVLELFDRTVARARGLGWLATARSFSNKEESDYVWTLREAHVELATGLALLLWPRPKEK